MADLKTAIKNLLRNVVLFSHHGSGIQLRDYQEAPARAIAESVIHNRGLSFVVIFPRQSGKNELQAQIEAYLLTLFSQSDAEIIKVSPTWKPQTLNAMRRLQRILERNLLTRGRWTKESGYIFRIGTARIFFLSGSPTSNVVGATASTLLECDEAQDVLASKWDKDFSPMAASTNATRVFWGTVWTSRTLLARELHAAREAEAADGLRRVFYVTADDVSKEVPAYGKFVAGQVARLGRDHPLVKTQFFCEEIDAQGGMFPPARLALLQGTHAPLLVPTPGKLYAILLDIAGEDEGAQDTERTIADGGVLVNARRDSTALTVVEVDLSTLADQLLKAPTYKVVSRVLWTGVKHSTLYADVRALVDHWRAAYTVIDATGIGAGLASFLDKAFTGRVIPFTFSQSSKSKLGWDFIAVVDSGRFKDHATTQPSALDNLHTLFLRQAEFCQYEVIPGPGKLLRWGVPDSQRDPLNNKLLHDDLLLSASLVAVLDEQAWPAGLAPLVIQRSDPLKDIDKEGF